jgi:DNA-binding transcriptional LysR family regulator
LSEGEITPSRYAQSAHIAVSRRGLARSAVDEALNTLGLERRVVTIVDSFSSALALAQASELVATVPERHTATLRAGMVSFSLPVATPEMTISMLWHPRMDGDAAHRWLRGLMLATCAAP